MINTTENPIAIRSKKMLSDALIELLHQKSFNAISVGELVETADLSRRTFYRLFSTKEEILLYHIGQLWQEEVPKLYAQEDKSFYTTCSFFFHFWHQYREIALILYQNELYGVLQKFLMNISDDVYSHQKKDYPIQNNPDAFAYVMSYTCGGIGNVVWKWASEGMTRTPEEVMELLMQAFQRP